MDLGLKDRVALVCGSSRGLGRAIAGALADEGARVALNGRDEGRLHAATEELTSYGGADVRPFPADVTIPALAERLVEHVVHEMGRLDILVCNAGGPPATTFQEAEADAWGQAVQQNLLSAIHLCRSAVPHMLRERWGRILMITSVAAKQPLAGLILSTTARAGVLGFAKSLADELAGQAITVNVLCPGYFGTERALALARATAERTGRPVAEVTAERLAAIPARRIGDPAELGAVAAFLASERASYITGVALSVDGGVTRAIA